MEEISHITTLADFENRFFDRLKETGKSHNTLKNYRTDLNCFFEFLHVKKIGKLGLSFSSESIREYGAYIQQRYDSSNSRRRKIQALRLFIDFLMDHNVVASNPATSIPVSPKKLDIPNPPSWESIGLLNKTLLQKKVLSEGERFNELLVTRNLVVIHLIYHCGLRVSQLSALVFSDVLEERILVRQKKRDPYTVPLPHSTQKLLSDYRMQLRSFQQEAQLYFELLFFNANHYKILAPGLSPRGIEILFKQLSALLGNSEILTPKSLRQAAIFWWLDQEIPETTIKEWLGVAPSYSLRPYRELYLHHRSEFRYFVLEQ